MKLPDTTKFQHLLKHIGFLLHAYAPRTFGKYIVFICTTLLLGSASSAQLSGDLNNLVSTIISRANNPNTTNFTYNLHAQNTDINLNIEHYFSTETSVSSSDNKCTATSSSSTIKCDLRLINNLAEEFDLQKPGAQDLNSKDLNTRTILKWIIAHEVGHIIKKHGVSDFSPPERGLAIFNAPQQQRELEADAYALTLVGGLNTAESDDYGVLLSIVNILIRKSLCPTTYPDPCEKISPGVGLLYNSSDQSPIKIHAGGNHPEFIARFVRIIYLSGLNSKQNSINYLAKKVIDKFLIESDSGDWMPMPEAMIPLNSR